MSAKLKSAEEKNALKTKMKESTQIIELAAGEVSSYSYSSCFCVPVVFILVFSFFFSSRLFDVFFLEEGLKTHFLRPLGLCMSFLLRFSTLKILS